MKPYTGKMAKVIRQEAAAHKLIASVLVGSESDIRYQQPKDCRGAGHCALGALAFAAGVSNRRLAECGGMPDSFPPAVHKALWETYRIDLHDMRVILDANDDVEGCDLNCTDTERIQRIKNRRDVVLKAINRIGKNKRQRHPEHLEPVGYGWPV